MSETLGSTVVLGGSGVAGTGIVNTLLDAGASVDVIDLRAPAREHERLRYIEGDVRSAEILERVRDYENVVVAFGQLARGLSEQPAAAWDINLAPTLGLIAAARGSCRRFVFISSAMIYDRSTAPEGPLSERSPVLGRCLYTHSKLAAEHALHCAVAAGLAPTLILRPFTIYGPGPLRGAAGHLIGRWLELWAAGEPLTIFGDGSQSVDLVPSAILGSACLRWFGEPEPPPIRILNASCGTPMQIGALAELFRSELPGVSVRSVEPPASSTPPTNHWGDAGALREHLGAPLPDPTLAMTTFLRERASSWSPS